MVTARAMSRHDRLPISKSAAPSPPGTRRAWCALAATALLATATLAAGCGPRLSVPGGGKWEDLPWYEGPECDQVRESDSEAGSASSKLERIDFDPRLHTLLQICERSQVGPRYRNDGAHDRRDKISDFDGRTVHWYFDGGEVDPVKSALFVVYTVDGVPGRAAWQEAGLRKVYAPVNRAGVPDEWREKPPETYGPIGVAHLWAEETDAAALAAALKKARLPDEARAIFEDRFTEARAFLRQRVLGMTPLQKKVFVDVPREVYKERKLYHELYKDLFARLDDLVADAKSKGTPAQLPKLLALRSEYMATCKEESCTFEPLYVKVTGEISKSCAQQRDALCVAAEAEVLKRKDIESELFANVVTRAQWKVALPSREAYELRERARQKNIDDATASAAAGNEPPVKFTEKHFGHALLDIPDYRALLDDGRGARPESASGVVGSIKKKGDVATLEFKGGFRVDTERYDCKRSGRLAEVTWEGRLVWEETCQTRQQQMPLPKPDNILLPAAEASSLQPGDLVKVLVAPGDPARNARVITAKTGTALVQLRADRLTPAPSK